MSDTSDQIEKHIQNTREDLSANLHELEEKVKSVTDWRQHYQKSPGMFLAAALGGGLLLALATNGRKSRGVPQFVALMPAPPQPIKSTKELHASMGVIKGALIGVAANQLKGVLSHLLPGFEAQAAEVEKRKPASPADLVRRTAEANGNGNGNGNAMPGRDATA